MEALGLQTDARFKKESIFPAQSQVGAQQKLVVKMNFALLPVHLEKTGMISCFCLAGKNTQRRKIALQGIKKLREKALLENGTVDPEAQPDFVGKFVFFQHQAVFFKEIQAIEAQSVTHLLQAVLRVKRCTQHQKQKKGPDFHAANIELNAHSENVKLHGW